MEQQNITTSINYTNQIKIYTINHLSTQKYTIIIINNTKLIQTQRLKTYQTIKKIRKYQTIKR